KNVESVIKSCERAIEEISKVPNVITPFPGGVVGSGSKVGSKKYPTILKASTNDAFCPTIKSMTNTLLKQDENCVMEIVINALDIDSMNTAMRNGIEAACSVDGITRITAGNYGGKLGKFLIHLHELFKKQ
ncbi:MAG: formylmethanofuran--tetrahydromethanopterin N-formyltransferase, partial [Candidatus Altarchaeaceae archaeon]